MLLFLAGIDVLFQPLARVLPPCAPQNPIVPVQRFMSVIFCQRCYRDKLRAVCRGRKRKGNLWTRSQRVNGALDLWRNQVTSALMAKQVLDPPTLSEIIEMALSDHASFDQIRALHGLGPDEVKTLMRQNLKPGSYRSWRRRLRQFADRREVYK